MSYTKQDAQRIIKYYDKSALDITITKYDFDNIIYETKEQIFTYEKYHGYYAGSKIYPLMVSNLIIDEPKVPFISVTALATYLYGKLDGEYRSLTLVDLKPLSQQHLKDKGLNDKFKNKLLKELIWINVIF